MVSGSDCKHCNVIESHKTVFRRLHDFFPILLKACFLYSSRATLKRLAFNSSAIKVYHPTPEYMVKSHPCLSNESKFESNHTKKCLDQLRVDKRDTDCFKHMHEENTKLSVNVSTSHAWIFLSTTVFYGCYRWERRSDGTLIEWESDNDVLVGISCLFILVEKNVAKFGGSKAAIQGRYEK